MPDTLHYRFARTDEIAEIARLVAHSFPGPTRTHAWWDEQLRDPPLGGGAETLLIGEDNGKKVAALQLHRVKQWIGGEALPVAGVGTVAIAPTHRQRRLGGELMVAALREARARGDVASSLYPFRTSFYRKLGYGLADEALQYQVPPSALRESSERQRIELLDTEAERAEALALYGRWARTQTGQIERGPHLWESLVAPQGRALVGYRGTDGELQGYALVVYRVDLVRSQRFLEVDELAWMSPEARRGLYGWLASLGDQWQQILIRALPSQRLGDWVAEPRLPYGSAPQWGLWDPAATLLVGTMFRLLDVSDAWERRSVTNTAPLTFVVEVTDAQFQDNTGRWRLALDGGRVAVKQNAKGDLTLRLDISTLSRLFIGSLSPSAGLRADLLECDRPDLLPALDAALALPEPWTFDRF